MNQQGQLHRVRTWVTLHNGTSAALLALVIVAALLSAVPPPASAAPARPTQPVQRGAAETAVIRDNYIVRFVDGANAAAEAAALAGRGSQVDRIYQYVFAGALVRLPEQAVEALRRNPRVASVEPDRLVSVDVAGIQPTPPWGLDRSDQQYRYASGVYNYPNTGAGVTAYVVDTGIRADHVDFGGRVRSGYTAIQDGRGTTDCHGHGTHVAGTVGGATYGMAKERPSSPCGCWTAREPGRTQGSSPGWTGWPATTARGGPRSST